MTIEEKRLIDYLIKPFNERTNGESRKQYAALKNEM